MPLYQVVDDGLQALGKLVSDPVRLADVLYCLVKDEADARQVSDEDFGRALAGDAITAAAEAFVEELIDFFPDARVRAGLRQVGVGGAGSGPFSGVKFACDAGLPAVENKATASLDRACRRATSSTARLEQVQRDTCCSIAAT